jgi:hypothetical protein
MDMESLRDGGGGLGFAGTAASFVLCGGGSPVFSVEGAFWSSAAKNSFIKSRYCWKLTLGAGKALAEGRPSAGGG